MASHSCRDGRVHDRLPHSASSGVGSRKVVAVAVQILTPDHDGIVGGIVGDPFGVNDGVLVQITFERELLGASGVGIPSSKFVAVPGRVVGFGTGERVADKTFYIIGYEEFGCGVGCARTVFVECQPVAVGKIFHKGDVAREVDNRAVGVYAVFTPVRFQNVAVAFHQTPSQEIRVGFIGYV